MAVLVSQFKKAEHCFSKSV